MSSPTRDDLNAILPISGIHDERVLAVFSRIPRASFVPPKARHSAYEDVPLSIAHGQVTTQPSLVALMVQALELTGDERVLEVGTGLGFQTAILASLCREVISVEWFADLTRQARQNLDAEGIRNATLVVGDGSLGVPERAPFDALVVAAAATEVSPFLADQLAEGGRLVQPLGPGGDERVSTFVKRSGRLVEQDTLTGARFVPLRGAFGVR
ncbi:MAG TPA: protein-L-isoaspartate(D-aspartate) O-methyltransferase [Chloroflexota bacterium]|nr:protein-L-isoaspartate(D-aspartate) O-methyltransferase [Chloroflexota bacterium]